MRDYDQALRNAAQQDPEQPDVNFYPISTSFTEAERNRALPFSGIEPQEFYDFVLDTWSPFGAPMPQDQYASAVIEGTWYDCLQPEYKAYPAIIAALAATKIEIGCEHLKMPFPAFAIRLPEGFVQEEGGPVIRCLLVAMLKNEGRGSSRPITSIESEPAAAARSVPFAISFRRETPEHVLLVQAKYIDKDGDDAFANFTIALYKDKTIEEQFDDWVKWTSGPVVTAHIRKAGASYYLGHQMARELLSLAVGISFFATGRHKATRPILQRDKKSRHERRQFEKAHDGKEQPTFAVGRELVLPREEGAPSRDSDAVAGEGSGRSLRWGHYRTGYLRYQAHGPGFSERKLIFIEPTLVRPDLPLRPRVTPGSVIGGRPSHDVTEPRSEQ